MWRRARRQQRQQHKWSIRDNSSGGSNSNDCRRPVGTEAAALANLKKNSASFGYPPSGFVNKIEYTLIYAMLASGSSLSPSAVIFPDSVVEQEIESEDFSQYLWVEPDKGQRYADEPPVSYAQLSALLALSAEKYPPQAQATEDTNQNQRHNSGSGHDEETDKDDYSSATNKTIPQKLCKVILQCVVKYANQHDLDRAVELRELIDPVQRYTNRRREKLGLRIVPVYLGCYTAALLTGNPLPLLIGAMAIGSNVQAEEMLENEARHTNAMALETERKTGVETASLLDEVEVDDDDD